MLVLPEYSAERSQWTIGRLIGIAVAGNREHAIREDSLLEVLQVVVGGLPLSLHKLLQSPWNLIIHSHIHKILVKRAGLVPFVEVFAINHSHSLVVGMLQPVRSEDATPVLAGAAEAAL